MCLYLCFIAVRCAKSLGGEVEGCCGLGCAMRCTVSRGSSPVYAVLTYRSRRLFSRGVDESNPSCD